LPLLSKVHEILSVSCQENRKKIVATRCQILRLICITKRLVAGLRVDPAGEFKRSSTASSHEKVAYF